MLRSPTDRLSIALAPGGIGVIRCQGEDRHPAQVLRYASVAEEPAWQCAIDTLAQWWDQISLTRATANLLIGDAFARYALVPWSPLRLKPAEEAALIRARFEESNGDMVGWRIVTDSGEYGTARIACAFPEEMIHRLHRQWLSRPLRGGRMLPYFVGCWNHWRKLIGQGHPGEEDARMPPCLFAVAEAGTLVVGLHADRGWISLRSLPVPDAKSLGVALSREGLLQGVADNLPVFLHAPGMSARQVEEVRDTVGNGVVLQRLILTEAGAIDPDPAAQMAALGIELGWLNRGGLP